MNEKRPKRFVCLIVGLQLGGMSGIDLHKQLKLAGVIIPMILLTARDEKRA
jgi:FixJ family two-component response regulator